MQNSKSSQIKDFAKLVVETRKDETGKFPPLSYGKFADLLNSATSAATNLNATSIRRWEKGLHFPNRDVFALICAVAPEDSWQRRFATRALEILYPPASVL